MRDAWGLDGDSHLGTSLKASVHLRWASRWEHVLAGAMCVYNTRHKGFKRALSSRCILGKGGVNDDEYYVHTS